MDVAQIATDACYSWSQLLTLECGQLGYPLGNQLDKERIKALRNSSLQIVERECLP